MSLRLWIVQQGMRLIAKPQLGRVKRPEKLRKSFDFSGRYFLKIPPYSTMLPAEIPGKTAPIQNLWISNSPATSRQVILYLHGGGYAAGNPSTHRGMLARLAKLSGLRVFAPDYRLAPEHPFPAALEDAYSAFSHLLSIGYRPPDIVIGGDSAGGGLAFALLSAVCQQGQPPGAVFAFSPWTDLTLSGASLKSNAKSDAFLPVRRIHELRDYYTGGRDPIDPGISPLFAKFPDCPPVFIQFSATEILRDDSARMAEALRQQGADVTEDEWDDAPHVWHILDGWVPEARTALKSTAAFIRQALSSGPTTGGN